MYQLSYDITIGRYRVKHLLSCQVLKSANKLSDTATIKLPGMAYNNALEIESKIKRGDQVTIKLGYNNILHQEFSGYVSSILTDNNIEIGCEDSMFLLRKSVENKQYKAIHVADLIADVVGQTGQFEHVFGEGISDVIYDKFTVRDTTAWEVLRKIQKETGIHIFFKQNELHTHLKYTYKSGDVLYDFARNVKSAKLKYVRESDKKVLVKVVGIDRQNRKVKVEVGDSGGDKITINRYNVTDTTTLRKIGLEELKKYRYTGYENGELETWLFPYCSYGDTAKIKNKRYPEREGSNYIEAVETNFSAQGGRRKVNLSIAL